MDTKNYNVTDLNPESTFERHVFHRDQFGHFFRRTYILKEAKIGDNIVDFGCGKGQLLNVLYRNRFKCSKYIGIDIRKQTIDKNKEEYKNLDWAKFECNDLVNMVIDDLDYQADKVCSFEVLEHVGKQNADRFIKNMIKCGKKDATFYISTPNYDEKVGAADNHTYDSGDGRGVQPQEFTHQELQDLFEKYFIIEKKIGMFASQSDYKPLLEGWKLEMFNYLKEVFDSNILSNMMAAFYPEQSRNTLWILKLK